MSKRDLETKLQIEKDAIQNCEKAVHTDIGLIQPFGYLLACKPIVGTVTHASENMSEWFERPLLEILGASIHDLLPANVVHQCKNAAGHSTITTQREHVGRLDSKNKPYDIFVHKKNDQLILEFQPANKHSSSSLKMLDTVQRILERLSLAKSAQVLMDSAVDELRALTEFHRVKTYRFLSDGAGEVIAESHEPQVDSFLGLRFPPFDVPQAARVLYATTPIRIIPSISAEQVAIIADDEQEPLDLSLALFRGVVPVHMLYLQNMGVKATLSLPIIINGKMWGLFAFHHMSECMLDSEVISALEILGGSISMMLGIILQRHQITRMEESSRVVSTLFVPDESSLGFSSYWDTASPELAKLIGCNGVVLVSDSRHDLYGDSPSFDVLTQLVNYLDSEYQRQDSEAKPIAIDSITAKLPNLECGKIAGVLAIPNPALSYRYLLFFRNDAGQTVRWAGIPSKDIDLAEKGFRLNPRASFEEYIDFTHKRSDAFDDEDMIVAEALKDSLARVSSTVSTHSQHRERLGLVIRELNHRVRNILALVSSIISQSRVTNHDLESFVSSLEQRVQALSETHKLLTEFDWSPIRIQLLFERVLAPYQAYLQTRIQLSGNEISIPPELASLFALVVHELASNAVKYGALSNSIGHINLHWEVDNESLTVSWKEAVGEVVQPPKRQGFGTTLVKEALAYEFDAKCSLDFFPQAVEAIFVIPRKNSNIIVEQDVSRVDSDIRTPKGFLALLLEDDYVIAKDTVRMLSDLGAYQVDTAPSLDRAEECIAKNNYDFALLDANIRGEYSVKIAELLYQKNVPFAFATGYGSKDRDLRATACIDVLSKPINAMQLLVVLNDAKVTDE